MRAAIAGLLLCPLTMPQAALGKAPDCARMASLALPGTAITTAAIVAADSVAAQINPEPPGMNVAGHSLPGSQNLVFCRIRATIRPGPQSEVKSEIWLPMRGWNGRFLHIGSFGWGGTINTAALLTGVQHGYATATNDTGHDASGPDGSGGKFAAGPRDRMLDYAGRANHDMVVATEAMIKAFYGKAQRHSYLIGCSLGGLQGLIAARKYPADYDGIVAGAPPNPIANFNALQVWPSYLVRQDPARAMTDAKFRLVHDAMVHACGTPVGQAQGFIEQPDLCRFAPADLQCKGADRPDCLTPAQVDLMDRIYRGPVNPRTGAVVMTGPAKGAETDLAMFSRPEPMAVAADMFRYVAFRDDDWFAKFDYADRLDTAIARIGPLMHVDADLHRYFARGGKLLLYIGWNDFHNPTDLIAYFKAVVARAGTAKARANTRLFTIPGMGHCAGGAGCDTFDKLGVIDAWVAHGAAPARIVTAKLVDGKVIRTRPICAWPLIARYNGTGDMAEAGSFDCGRN